MISTANMRVLQNRVSGAFVVEEQGRNLSNVLVGFPDYRAEDVRGQSVQRGLFHNSTVYHITNLGGGANTPSTLEPDSRETFQTTTSRESIMRQNPSAYYPLDESHNNYHHHNNNLSSNIDRYNNIDTRRSNSHSILVPRCSSSIDIFNTQIKILAVTQRPIEVPINQDIHIQVEDGSSSEISLVDDPYKIVFTGDQSGWVFSSYSSGGVECLQVTIIDDPHGMLSRLKRMRGLLIARCLPLASYPSKIAIIARRFIQLEDIRDLPNQTTSEQIKWRSGLVNFREKTARTARSAHKVIKEAVNRVATCVKEDLQVSDRQFDAW